MKGCEIANGCCFCLEQLQVGKPSSCSGCGDKQKHFKFKQYTHTIAPGSNAVREDRVDMLDQRVSLMFNPPIELSDLLSVASYQFL